MCWFYTFQEYFKILQMVAEQSFFYIILVYIYLFIKYYLYFYNGYLEV